MARVDLPLGNAVLIAVLGVVALVAGIVVLVDHGCRFRTLFGIGADSRSASCGQKSLDRPELWRLRVGPLLTVA